MTANPALTCDDDRHPSVTRFRAFLRDATFPCVGAKAAEGRGQIAFIVARDIASAWDDLPISRALIAFAGAYRRAPRLFQSLVVIFQNDTPMSEEVFESRLWARVQSLSDKDAWHGQTPDRRVSGDPASPDFSLSFGGEAFFVVGLHPGASRPGRRFESPALVFNLHDQFERLRQSGAYEKLRAAILARDLGLAGTANPMVSRHGETSEARQYSGRAVGDDWTCPFASHRQATANVA